MAEEKKIRLSQAARELNVGISTITDTLIEKGFKVEGKANAKISFEQLEMLAQEFDVPMDEINIVKNFRKKYINETEGSSEATETAVEEKPQTKVQAKTSPEEEKKESPQEEPASVKKPDEPQETKITEKPVEQEQKKAEETEAQSEEKVSTRSKLPGLKVVDKIDLSSQGKKSSKNTKSTEKSSPKTEAKVEVKEESKAPDTPKVEEKKPKAKSEAPKEKANTEKESLPSDEKVENEKKTEEKPQSKKVAEVEKKTEAKAKKTEEKQSEKAVEAKEEKKAEPESTPEKEPVPASDTSENTPDNEESQEASDTEGQEDGAKIIKGEAKTLKGLTILGKIELPDKSKKGSKPVASSDDKKKKRKRKKKRIRRDDSSGGSTNSNTNNSNKGNNSNNNRGKSRGNKSGNNANKTNEISDTEIQNQIKATLAKMSNRNKIGRKTSRSQQRKERNQEQDLDIEENNLLQVTEFISANDLASLMDTSVTEVISTCMNMGMFISINQRLDAEAITLIADEFGYDVEFISAVEEDSVEFEEVADKEEDLSARAPIVTIMGHVDHGKTSLLDYIRNANVTSQESGGITQHIGAYDVLTEDGRRLAFLDTPGHEAFTAMRARGAKVTDIVILVVAADDDVMPQTKEAINHAQVAGVPIVIAINKVDKASANPERIREALSKENILVESWGGKYQDQEISAKTGQGIEDLLEKVLLEAELLELKANPNKNANGTVIEASLDKGRGYVATVLVQAGTLKVGDIILAGSHYGRVKAMNNHLGKRVKKAPPATPVQVLGLSGAPQSGDLLKVMDSEREAREIASKREQILREQNIRATKGLTLEEIGRRRLLGNFQELKIIVKGDVDGSVEALSDSLLKNSTEEIEVKIIHKAVGQISEADVMLASASEAIIVGFQVRPSLGARKAAEQEKVQIKLYSVIYNAIEEVRDAMEGMLAPTTVEEIVGNAEVRDVFKISKIGTVAGCYVTDGTIKRNNRVRIIRDGIVTYEGEIDALKRFKDDVNEVKTNFECGLSIRSFNDIKVGDVIESYEEKEVKRKLSS